MSPFRSLIYFQNVNLLGISFNIIFISSWITFFQNYEQVIASANLSQSFRARIVTIRYGGLKGIIINLPNSSLQKVEAFLGVPYASPPVGKLRFMPPVSSAHWDGIKLASSHASVCPQKLPKIINESEALQFLTQSRLNILKKMLPLLQNQSEDCLYLNIYVPLSATTKKVPVMLFIHGESYDWGSGSSYDGSVLASFGDVIVVTFNYRLGILGFLATPDRTGRGNFGIMDQVAALHWIQENINKFGGDHNNVTIFGQGYGASFVNILMMSPMAKGLFQRAIMQSGSALSPFAIANDVIRYSYTLAQKLNCPSDNTSAILIQCLREKSIKEILSVDFEVPSFLTAFGPTVDGIVIPNDPLIIMLNKTSLFSKYDLLFGATKTDSYYHFNNFDEKSGITFERKEKIIRTLVRNLFTFHLQEMFLIITNEYNNLVNPNPSSSTIFESVAELLSDSIIIAPMVRAATFHSERNPRTFYYIFLYSSQNAETPFSLGCTHGHELSYIFGAPLIAGFQLGFFNKAYTRQETELAESVITYWTNFAKYGEPSPIGRKYIFKTERLVPWPNYDEFGQHYLAITLNPKIKNHYNAHRLSYWLNLIPKLHISGPYSTSLEHHMLSNHDNLSYYEGMVRDSNHRSAYLISAKQIDLIQTRLLNNPKKFHQIVEFNNMSDFSNIVQTYNIISDSSYHQSVLESVNQSVWNQPITYRTTLSVIIVTGLALLILNFTILAITLYQRHKIKKIKKKLSQDLPDDHDESSKESKSSLNFCHVLSDANLNPIQSNHINLVDPQSMMTVQQWINQEPLPTTLSDQIPINYQTSETLLNTMGHLSADNYKFQDNQLVFVQFDENDPNCINYINGDLFNHQFKTLSASNETDI